MYDTLGREEEQKKTISHTRTQEHCMGDTLGREEEQKKQKKQKKTISHTRNRSIVWVTL